MTVLLDTDAFLWWITNDPRLSARARQIIGDPDTRLLLSAASGWEIGIKASLGRLSLAEDLHAFMAEQLRMNGIRVLPIHMTHALRASALPPHHRDPFDRMLVAQSQTEAVPILTADANIARYDVIAVW